MRGCQRKRTRGIRFGRRSPRSCAGREFHWRTCKGFCITSILALRDSTITAVTERGWIWWMRLATNDDSRIGTAARIAFAFCLPSGCIIGYRLFHVARFGSRSAVTQIGARKFIQHLLPNNMTMSDGNDPSPPVLLQLVMSESAALWMRVHWTK